MRNYTTIEQSKHLLELGLDPKTHDIYYEDITMDEPFTKKIHIGQSIAIMDDLFSYRQGYTIPCWSTGALMNLMKPIGENTYTITGTLDGGAFVQFDGVTTVAFQEKTAFVAVYNMICWLLENGYINKNKDDEENSFQR
ncbi:MAG: hypothetical protein J6X18_08940 [Bacteroidales bacterium]|nr:hypothetical protein [Bacteroidales bacterium]